MKKAKSATSNAPRRPVSEKFYDEIIHRVAVTVCNNLDQPKDVIQHMKLIINAYLDRGDKPTKTESTSIRLMFSLLQPELDKAIARSARARQAAERRRKARQEAALSKAAEISASETSEATEINLETEKPADESTDRQNSTATYHHNALQVQLPEHEFPHRIYHR